MCEFGGHKIRVILNTHYNGIARHSLFYLLFVIAWLFVSNSSNGLITIELTDFYGAQRSKNPVQRFVSCFNLLSLLAPTLASRSTGIER